MKLATKKLSNNVKLLSLILRVNFIAQIIQHSAGDTNIYIVVINLKDFYIIIYTVQLIKIWMLFDLVRNKFKEQIPREFEAETLLQTSVTSFWALIQYLNEFKTLRVCVWGGEGKREGERERIGEQQLNSLRMSIPQDESLEMSDASRENVGVMVLVDTSETLGGLITFCSASELAGEFKETGE